MAVLGEACCWGRLDIVGGAIVDEEEEQAHVEEQDMGGRGGGLCL